MKTIVLGLLLIGSVQANEVFYWDPEMGGGYTTYDDAIYQSNQREHQLQMEQQLYDQERRLQELESQQNDNDVNHYRYLLQPK